MKYPLKTIITCTIAAIVILTIATLMGGKVLFQNVSPSAPEGIYIAGINQEIQSGDFVVVALPADIPALGAAKGYPMIKKVRGWPGDTYSIEDDGLHFNGRIYRIYHRPGLSQLEKGTYTVPENHILFLNDPDISFDSRYLGPIKKTQVIRKVNLLIPFRPIDDLLRMVNTDETPQENSRADSYNP